MSTGNDFLTAFQTLSRAGISIPEIIAYLTSPSVSRRMASTPLPEPLTSMEPSQSSPPPRTKGGRKTEVQTMVMGQPYKVVLSNRGRGQPLDIDYLGRLYAPHKDVPTVESDKLLRVLQRKGVEFIPSRSPASEADHKRYSKPGVSPDDFQQKRVRMFERLMGGAAKRVGNTAKWGIPAVLSLLIAFLANQNKGEET